MDCNMARYIRDGNVYRRVWDNESDCYQLGSANGLSGGKTTKLTPATPAYLKGLAEGTAARLAMTEAERADFDRDHARGVAAGNAELPAGESLEGTCELKNLAFMSGWHSAWENSASSTTPYYEHIIWADRPDLVAQIVVLVDALFAEPKQ
jgi:hypothetical protein